MARPPILAHFRMESAALDRKTSLCALIPDGPGPWPVLYLLHGLGGDQESWLRDYPLQQQASAYRMMIVMPYGGTGFFVNDPRPGGLGAGEDFIVRDVVDFVDRTFEVRQDRAGRAIAGLSMGGYGALMLALRHPECFGAAASLSGALYFAARPHPLGNPERQAFMAVLPEGRYDLYRLSAELSADRRPALAFNCGLEDYQREGNLAFHRHLDTLGYPHDYAEYPGRHDQAYWAARLPALLDGMARRLDALPLR